MTFNPTDLLGVAPEIATLILALAVIMIELLVSRNEEVLQGIVSIGLLAVMAVTVISSGSGNSAFYAMVSTDAFTFYFKILLTGIALLAVLMSRDYLKGFQLRHGEYYCLILLATVGMMVLASANNMLTLFLGIEIMSIALYILAGFRSGRLTSSEAALKYFLLGAFSTGFLLYGIALIYGATGGKTNFGDISTAIKVMSDSGALPIHLYAGTGLIMVGMLFKVAAVPFHFWSPDVYEGAPTPITAFMSAGPKAAAMVAFLKLFGWALPDISYIWQPILGIVAAATMILGNVIALAQTNIKRMLAYSSISHAGYLLLAILAAGNSTVRSNAAAGMYFYLVAYYLMNIGAFTVAILVNRARPDGNYQLNDYQGFAAGYPWVSIAMAVFMISLAGIPPSAGFFGKLYIFSAAVKAGFVPLVVIAVLASVLSVYYYLRVVVYMFMRPQPAGEAPKMKLSPVIAIVLIICTAGILHFGILPGSLMKAANAGSEKIWIQGTGDLTLDKD